MPNPSIPPQLVLAGLREALAALERTIQDMLKLLEDELERREPQHPLCLHPSQSAEHGSCNDTRCRACFRADGRPRVRR